ncbi:MAG: pseudouridine synthase [Patescibacteria group bacterium]
MSVVLQKYIADSGHCSRREAERLIRAGKIKLNNRVAELGSRVEMGDRVSIGNKGLYAKQENLYIALNKPVGYVCSNRKFENEKNIFDLISLRDKLFVSGRLDKESHGLVFLTNDGVLAQNLSHPSFGHEKEYEVKVDRDDLDPDEVIRKFRKGIDIGEGDGYVRAKFVEQISNNRFRIVLTEGKKRQIRRMFAFFDCKVIDLVRVRIGSEKSGLRLGKLQLGEWRFLSDKEVKGLKEDFVS